MAMLARETVVISTEFVQNHHCNIYNICSGSTFLTWIDSIAGASARRAAGEDCVTASIDTVHIMRPCFPGNIVTISATVNRCFKTSMEVGVRIEVEDISLGLHWYVCSAYLTFVKKPSPLHPDVPVRLPEIAPQSESEQQRYDSALERRQTRLSLNKSSLGQEQVEHHQALPYELFEAVDEPFQTATAHGQLTEKPAYYRFTLSKYTIKVFPQHTNSKEITFGGLIMGWMERVAHVSAARYATGNHAMLLTSIDKLVFKNSTQVGDLLSMLAKVNAAFNASLEVLVTVYRNREGVITFCNSGYYTFVPVDKNTLCSIPLPKPKCALPNEVTESKEFRRHFQLALERRDRRKELKLQTS